MKQYLITTLLFFVLSSQVVGQQQPAVDKNIVFHKIESIDPENLNFSDLSFLKNEIGEARVILLGEPTHGEGNVIEAKTRLINYFHEEMGFNVIAFESGFYDVAKAQAEIERGESSVEESLAKSLFPIWTETREFQPLIKIIKQEGLKVAGFDPQFSGEYYEDMMEELQQFLSREKSAADIDYEYMEEVVAIMGEHYTFPPTHNYAYFEKQTGKAFKLLNKIEDGGSRKKEAEFWKRCLKNLVKLSFDYLQNDPSSKTRETFRAQDSNVRDALMAENLLYILKKYPQEKIICWGATPHFLNKVDELNNAELKSFVPMGSILKASLPGQVYILGTATGGGKYGNIFTQPNEVPAPQPGSLEARLKDLDAEVLFLNAAANFKGENVTASIIEYTPLTGKWGEALDGILFMREVNPPHPAGMAQRQESQSGSNGNGPGAIPVRGDVKVSKQHNEKGRPPVKENMLGDYEISGIVLDHTSKKGIPFASVGSKDGKVGVITNIKGEFRLSLTKWNEADSLLIRCLGYEQEEVEVSEKHMKVLLSPKNYELKGIHVEAERLSAKKIMVKALNSIPLNYLQDSFNSSVYTRASSTNFDTLVYDVEYTSRVYNPDGYNGRQDLISHTEQVRWNKKDLSNKSQLFQYSQSGKVLQNIDLVNDNPLFNLKRIKSFEFELGPVLNIGDREVFVVHFLSKKQNDKTTGMHYVKKYYGKLFIDTEDFAIIKCEAVWERDTVLLNSFAKKYFNKGGRPAMLWHDLYKNYTVSQVLNYTKDLESNKYVLDNSRTEWMDTRYDMLNRENLDVRSVLAVKFIHTERRKNLNFDGNKNLLLKDVSYDPGFWNKYQPPTQY